MFVAPNTTADDLLAQSPESQRQLWRDIADMFESGNDPFQTMEGGPESIIETITDTSKGRGHKITFDILARFHGRGKMGNERFSAQADYEKMQISNNQLVVDAFRHGFDPLTQGRRRGPVPAWRVSRIRPP